MSKLLTCRISEETAERVEREAERQFEGKSSMVVRASIDLYLSLREAHGPRFDLVVEQMRNGEAMEVRAA